MRELTQIQRDILDRVAQHPNGWLVTDMYPGGAPLLHHMGLRRAGLLRKSYDTEDEADTGRFHITPEGAEARRTGRY